MFLPCTSKIHFSILVDSIFFFSGKRTIFVMTKVDLAESNQTDPSRVRSRIIKLNVTFLEIHRHSYSNLASYIKQI